MIRRSFRIGLTLGLLGGLAFALAKMFGPRPEPQANLSPATTDPWPQLDPDMARPSPPAVAMVPDPIAPTPRFSIERPRVAAESVVAPPVTPPPVVAAPVVAAPVVAAPVTPVPAPRPAPAKAAPAKKSTAKTAAKKAPAKKKAPATAWVTPKGDVCPTTHPVKAKLTSKIFHLPGMLNYARTHPDRCYRDAKAAEADGLRPSKR